ncbi:GIY-YIG nuclease family protein [Parapedobacter indicus]|uniref:GIY-YIG nuclease family protein n=1 Tax=Parapedobacter indicus TaxID=1477437 RepID=UPI000CEC5ABA|nr:GIY-YIG nuclease family protein [Parapedobacter indicus]PPL01904.1 putative endonuclease [Parapedobacter indicus]
MHYLYIIYSASLDRYYIGSCNDIPQRLRRHNTNHSGFTGRASDWMLVYREAYPSKHDATLRERQIKSWKNRTVIQRLISKA